MNRKNRFLATSKSFEDFFHRNELLPNGPKGDNFEGLVKKYLQTAPEYRSKLTDVWLRTEVPADVREHLGLPKSKGDEGIDLIARTRDGNIGPFRQSSRQARPATAPVEN